MGFKMIISSKDHPKTSSRTKYIINKKRTCVDEYNSEYWRFIENWIIQTKAKENLFNLLDKLESLEGISTMSDYYNLCEIIKNLKEYEINKKSFINFIRHFPALNLYIHHKNYNISAENTSIRFHMWKDDINLVLHFKDDYLIDFFSYDNDESCLKDKLVYSMKGEFSSSSNLKKSHKISRLLAVMLGDSIEEDIKYIQVGRYKLPDSERFHPIDGQNKIY